MSECMCVVYVCICVRGFPFGIVSSPGYQHLKKLLATLIKEINICFRGLALVTLGGWGW